MVYIDVDGNELESVDLSLGYLVDAEWVDHPKVKQSGHYEYNKLENGQKVQRFVVDTPARAAYREITVQKYILYTEEELAQMSTEQTVEERVSALEQAIIMQ